MKNMIKFSLIFFLILTLTNCNDRNEENLIQNIERVKIDSVKIAQDTMAVFTIQSIKTFSNFTTKCEGFYGYDYIYTDQLTRSVSSFKFQTATDCGEEVTRASQINFQPQIPGDYLFRFWNGKDAEGKNKWIEKTITVE